MLEVAVSIALSEGMLLVCSSAAASVGSGLEQLANTSKAVAPPANVAVINRDLWLDFLSIETSFSSANHWIFEQVVQQRDVSGSPVLWLFMTFVLSRW